MNRGQNGRRQLQQELAQGAPPELPRRRRGGWEGGGSLINCLFGCGGEWVGLDPTLILGTKPTHSLFGCISDFEDAVNPSHVWLKELRIRVGWQDNTIAIVLCGPHMSSSSYLLPPSYVVGSIPIAAPPPLKSAPGGGGHVGAGAGREGQRQLRSGQGRNGWQRRRSHRARRRGGLVRAGAVGWWRGLRGRRRELAEVYSPTLRLQSPPPWPQPPHPPATTAAMA
jgi:hypothetical protein